MKTNNRSRKPKILEVCSHPECSHMGLLITKIHCRQAHNMERDELFSKYGQPKPVEVNREKRKQNSRIRTIYANNGTINEPGWGQGMR